jgi:hypothetical protein
MSPLRLLLIVSLAVCAALIVSLLVGFAALLWIAATGN